MLAVSCVSWGKHTLCSLLWTCPCALSVHSVNTPLRALQRKIGHLYPKIDKNCASQSHNGHHSILVFTRGGVRHTHILTFFKSPADATIRATATGEFSGEAQGQHNGLPGSVEASHRLVRVEGTSYGQNLLLFVLGFNL